MTTSAPTPPTDLDLHLLAQRFLHAVYDSADVRRIGRATWWERGKTALETGAASSTMWRQCVTKTGKKMEVTVYNAASAATIAELSIVLDDPVVFGRWRQVAARDALTITAHVRNERHARRATTKEESS